MKSGIVAAVFLTSWIIGLIAFAFYVNTLDAKQRQDFICGVQLRSDC